MRTIEGKYGEFHVLTLSEIEAYMDQGPGRASGSHLRFYCPVHGSDRRRSLSVNADTGQFKCFSCEASGYVEDLRPNASRSGVPFGAGRAGRSTTPRVRRTPPPEPRPELAPVLRHAQSALAKNTHAAEFARTYIRRRGISESTAARYGLGFAADGDWPHISEGGAALRQWRHGRIVVPLTNPEGEIISLYGRAVRVARDDAPPMLRHAKLPGPQGIFNAAALRACDRVYVCEGAFDALSLAEVGVEGPIALCGVSVPPWMLRWLCEASEVVFALDNDEAGAEKTGLLKRALKLRGKRVAVLPPEAYGGYKDLNQALVSGCLNVPGLEP